MLLAGGPARFSDLRQWSLHQLVISKWTAGGTAGEHLQVAAK